MLNDTMGWCKKNNIFLALMFPRRKQNYGTTFFSFFLVEIPTSWWYVGPEPTKTAVSGTRSLGTRYTLERKTSNLDIPRATSICKWPPPPVWEPEVSVAVPKKLRILKNRLYNFEFPIEQQYTRKFYKLHKWFQLPI